MDNIFVMSRVGDCQVIELDKHSRPNGNITVVEDCITVPFDIRRIYYLYDVPGGEERGGHAHRVLYQLIVAAMEALMSFWMMGESVVLYR